MTSIDPPLKAGTKLCIVKPNVGLSTPTVFKSLRYDLLSEQDPEDLLAAFLDQRDKNDVALVEDEYYINDLEDPAFLNLPELQELKKELLAVEGFHHVLMSGSGTSIFCIGEPKDMDGFCNTFSTREGLNVFFTEFVNRDNEDVWYAPPPPPPPSSSQ
mmetsp:Transcript_2477/g.3647  ORF Transcript_2477/g.3647 Transcript_2477/m.3647 type:complete len:158 (+) Transcript_2477:264-737(+)|eukprot:CAMPEP_0118701474 /NCGR_PEP_ID=MMETSP0800-20121206/17274_1 /TAXON_ID=210618 ORGANISM="Striatella unipunctata, Strain CCMP2910" /NCGR_SAMPLE_ID=MMETSP0800 /ASSEMBLY_ACC=CAM_ASM_000638 /LENGTH=157 /DNA_ID=CAMNT_0006602405 /DNA_START=135 /DNA_END=608 /DNA_ORIENTATION=+